MRTIIIGDVHGCLKELQELIQTLRPSEGDKVIFCGDLVDRGPDSAGVVRYVRGLGEATKATIKLVRGNHEKKHLRQYTKWEQGKESKSPSAAYIKRIYNRMGDDDKHFLQMSVPWYAIPNEGIIVVHAGFTPTMQDLPTWDDYFNNMPAKARRKWDRVMHTRFVTPDGAMVQLGDEEDSDIYWAHIYDGRFGHVYFGHQVFMDGEPAKFPHATGLDLGCVYGGHLCAAVLRDGEVSYVKIKAHEEYYTSAFPMRKHIDI